MAKGIKVRVSADANPLKRGLSAARASIKQFAKVAAAGFAIGGAATLAASLVALREAARGLKDAFAFGGKMSDMAAQTGIAAGQMAILHQAFQDVGVDGEKARNAVTRLQKSIYDAANGLSTATRAFETLGLNVDDLRSKTPAEQFDAVANALGSLTDQTLKAGAASDIFGRSGAQLMELFNDSGAIGRASVTLGRQAELLDRHAGTFDRIADILASAGAKLRGFYVGLGSKVAPSILGVLEAFNALDFAGIGERVGNAVNKLVSAIKSGQVFDLVRLGFVVAMQTAAMEMHLALRKVFTQVLKFFADSWGVTTEEVGKELERRLIAAQSAAEGAFRKGLFSGGLTNYLRLEREANRPRLVAPPEAYEQFGEDEPRSIWDAISEKLNSTFESLVDPTAAAQLKDLWESLSAGGPLAATPGSKFDPAAVGGEGGEGGEDDGPTIKDPGINAIASSLARVGGGGAGFGKVDPLVEQAKKQTDKLTSIDSGVMALNTTLEGVGAGVSAYA